MPIYAIHCPSCGEDGGDIFRKIAEMDRLPICHCGNKFARKICAPMVMGDLPEYQAVAFDAKTGTAPRINGRAQHREFLRRNDYIEVGNEKRSAKPFDGHDPSLKDDVARATKQVLAQPGHIKR